MERMELIELSMRTSVKVEILYYRIFWSAQRGKDEYQELALMLQRTYKTLEKYPKR